MDTNTPVKNKTTPRLALILPRASQAYSRGISLLAISFCAHQAASTARAYTFTHPLTVTTPTELAQILSRINSGTDPQKLAYSDAANGLIHEADRLLSLSLAGGGFVGTIPSNPMNIMGGYEPNSNLDQMRKILNDNSHAAYTLALAWKLSGNAAYANKSALILNAWAQADMAFTGLDAPLQLGACFTRMLYAVDILRSGAVWPQANYNTFHVWWDARIIPLVTDAALNKTNNWKDAGILGLMAAGIAFEDGGLVDLALPHIGYIFEGRWKITKDGDPTHGVYLHEEVARAERGVTYTGLALTLMVQYLEMARHLGYDYWSLATPQGATVPDLIEQYYNWDIAHQSYPFYAGVLNELTPPSRRNSYEVGRNHALPGSAMAAWVDAQGILAGQEGDDWTTLTKGDMTPAFLTPPSPPAPGPVVVDVPFTLQNPPPGWTTTNGTWSIVTNSPHIYYKQSNVGASATRAIYTPFSAANMSVESRMQVIEFGASGRAGIYARYQDANNFYRLALRNNPFQIELKKTVNGVGSLLAGRELPISLNTWYVLKLEVTGTTLKGYLDGDLILLANDSSLGSGGFGTDTGSAQARFDYFIVR